MNKTLIWLAENGLLLSLADEYIKECLSSSPEEKKKGTGRFPNLAGFCRSMDIGVDSLYELREKYPDEHSKLCAVFEDEALNSAQSATVVSAYMKERLLWGEEKAAHRSSLEADGIQLVFEHDIGEDGA